MRPDSANGVVCAVVAYVLWGILPVYWKALQTVPAPQILGHRIAWSFFFLASLVLARREWRDFKNTVRQPKVLLTYALAGGVLAVNWLTYIWAVNSGQIVETSLGYFINPLVSILLSLLVLRERFHWVQWIAIGLAALGVAYLTFQHGGLPWVALVLAFSFALYSLLKKKAPLGALHGLTLETAVLVVPAIGYLAQAESSPAAGLLHSAWRTRWLLAGTGVITALPLLLFAQAAREIKLSTLGLLQYVSPTCGLALGVWLYGEPFSAKRLLGFAIIWIALGVSWLDWALRRRRLKGRLEEPQPTSVPGEV